MKPFAQLRILLGKARVRRLARQRNIGELFQTARADQNDDVVNAAVEALRGLNPGMATFVSCMRLKRQASAQARNPELEEIFGCEVRGHTTRESIRAAIEVIAADTNVGHPVKEVVVANSALLFVSTSDPAREGRSWGCGGGNILSLELVENQWRITNRWEWAR